MARKSHETPDQSAAGPPRGTSNRDKAVDALMALLAEHPFDEIGLAEVAGRAGIKLSELRAEFGSTLAIFAAHIKDIDRIVLDGGDGDMERGAAARAAVRRADAPPRGARALQGRGALASCASARRNPGLALALNAMALRSQTWMLEAAGIGASRPARRAARAGRGADVWRAC